MGIAAGNWIIRGFEVAVGPEAVMRRLGMGSSGAGAAGELGTLIARGIGTGIRLLVPAAVCATMEIERCAGGTVSFEGTGFAIRSADVEGLLAPCARATLIGATVGAGLSSAAGRVMGEKRMTEAMILDAYGSEAVEAVIGLAVDRLGREAGAAGFALTRRFSPGYGDWALSSQPGVLEAMGAARIGIASGPECILVPEKSVTAVLGWISKEK